MGRPQTNAKEPIQAEDIAEKPPLTKAEIKTKVAAKRAAAAAAMQATKLESFNPAQLDHRFNVLSISQEAADELMLHLEKNATGSFENALSIIRAWFNLQTPATPPKLSVPRDTGILSAASTPSISSSFLEVYCSTPDEEDISNRDNVLAAYYLDALLASHGWGFSTLQSVCWVTLFSICHEEFTGTSATSSSLSDTALYIQIIQSNIQSMLLANKSPWNTPTDTPKRPIFNTLQVQNMLDYFIQICLPHARLYKHFFTKPRDLHVTFIEKSVQINGDPLPLSKGIPAENWNDYLASEAARIRKEKKDELASEAIERAKREKALQEKHEREAAEYAELLKIRRDNMIITVPPIEPYSPENPVHHVDPDALFPIQDGSLPNLTTLTDLTLLQSKPITSPSANQAARQSVVAPPPVPAQPRLSTLQNRLSTSRQPSISGPSTTETPPTSKLSKETPLTPSTIATVISTNASTLLAALTTHLENKIDYQAAEIANRFVKVSGDRIALKKYEREEEEKMAVLMQQRAAAEEAEEREWVASKVAAAAAAQSAEGVGLRPTTSNDTKKKSSPSAKPKK
ncbi:hypothetical protein CcCBS67573_g06526 [Chytriomyces confervae]|uniref:Uncharacterized protein n=1 Tax=Chytriomyces confervae TaxID=246404 RepID=A0A507F2I2_9FUNG|nr:hypothetical protein CcCBS67573_g06526 [Chytriomyces confervae]